MSIAKNKRQKKKEQTNKSGNVAVLTECGYMYFEFTYIWQKYQALCNIYVRLTHAESKFKRSLKFIVTFIEDVTIY